VNAVVTMSVFSIEGGRTDVAWDVESFPYLARVAWGSHGPLTLMVMSRDQRTAEVLTVEADSGATKVVREDHDEYWLHLVDGVPAWLPGGRLLTTIHDDDTRRVAIDGEPVSPVGLQVDRVLDAGDEVVFTATDDPTEMHLFRLNLVTGELERDTKEPGVHVGAASGRVTVVGTATIEGSRHSFTVTRDGPPIEIFTTGERGIRCALLTPKDATGKLPVLLDPYGGPHFNMVVRSYRAMLEHQWWADQGFAVLVADGRGTMYRGLAWEREIHHELADRALQDQVDALHGAAERHSFMDLSRVAIRGWSFGGYLTCLALLRRPDVFHAGVSGAPVTDLSLYDTFYMERYLGDPNEFPEVYERNSVIKDAPNLEGKLMLVHGISDDNVYVAHTLALSKALMEAGRPHTVLPLSGITHRPTDETVAENLLMLELEFLRNALGLVAPPRATVWA
jgi:dipeptidyl-peptidase 4